MNGSDIEDSARFLRKVFRQRLADAERGAAQLVAAGPPLLRMRPANQQ